MIHGGDCFNAFCVDLDNNPEFIGQNHFIGTTIRSTRNDAGIIVGTASNVSEIVDVPATFELYLTEAHSVIQTYWTGASFPVETTPLLIGTATYQADTCSWIGEIVHPTGGALGAYEPAMFFELWAYNADNGKNFWGKLWADDWDVDCWLRLRGGWSNADNAGTFEIQPRHLQDNALGVCEWLPLGNCTMPSWMQGFPKKVNLSMGVSNVTCECNGHGGNFAYSGEIMPANGTTSGIDPRLFACQDDNLVLHTLYRKEDFVDPCIRGVYLYITTNREPVFFEYGEIINSTYAQLYYSHSTDVWVDGVYVGEQQPFPNAVINPWGTSTVFFQDRQWQTPSLQIDCLTPDESATITAVWQ